MPLDARRFVRKMRGGAQSHLVEADDGHYYVVKFLNNPQHRRILVNELVASVFLKHLQLTTPGSAIVRVGEDFLRANPGACFQVGSRRVPVLPGWHFGSRYPGDPAQVAVYDFVPDTLLQEVANLGEFLGMLVFDKWTANADARQSIFVRARLREWRGAAGAHPSRLAFLALMIDHGYAFNGPAWDLDCAPLQGLYHRPVVYAGVRSLEDFQPWLDQIRYFPEVVFDDALKQIPPEWIEDDRPELERLLEGLLARRRRLEDLILECWRARPQLFPLWRS